MARPGIGSGVCLRIDDGEEKGDEHIFPDAFFQIQVQFLQDGGGRSRFAHEDGGLFGKWPSEGRRERLFRNACDADPELSRRELVKIIKVTSDLGGWQILSVDFQTLDSGDFWARKSS